MSRICFDRPQPVLGSRTFLPQRFAFSLPAVFIARLQRQPVSSGTSKAERWSSGDHGSIWDSWPIAFSDHPHDQNNGHEMFFTRDDLYVQVAAAQVTIHQVACLTQKPFQTTSLQSASQCHWRSPCPALGCLPTRPCSAASQSRHTNVPT